MTPNLAELKSRHRSLVMKKALKCKSLATLKKDLRESIRSGQVELVAQYEKAIAKDEEQIRNYNLKATLVKQKIDDLTENMDELSEELDEMQSFNNCSIL